MKNLFIKFLLVMAPMTILLVLISSCARPVDNDDLKGAVLTQMRGLFFKENLYENSKFSFDVLNLESIYQKRSIENGEIVMTVKYRCDVCTNDGKNKKTVKYEGVISFIRKSGGHLPLRAIEKPKIIND